MTIHRRTQRRLCSTRRGATLVLVAVLLVPLLAVVGLAIDVGNVNRQRRIAQTAADAAALAGAYEILRGKPDSLLPSARNESARNGFSNGVGGVVVNASNPPSSGYYAAESRFVEVSVSNSVPTMFAKLVGFNSFEVNARAVAGLEAPGFMCVFVTSESENPALRVGNGASLRGAGCSLYVNSNGASAIQVQSGASSITASSIAVRGGASVSASGTISPPATTGVPVAQNPLAYLQMPALPAGCTYTNKVVSANETLVPGTFCGGLTVTGPSTRVTLNPGNYFMVGGGLSISSATVSGSGVTIFNTYNSTYAFQPIVFRTGATVNLSAPSSGTYAGVLFFGDPSAPTGYENRIETGSGSSFVGTFYMPANKVVFQTGSDLTITGGIVAKMVEITNGSSVTFTGYTSGIAYPIKRVSLVE